MKMTSKTNFLLCLLFVMLFFCSCGIKPSKPCYSKDGKVYGKVQGNFRHKWWNYYERGLSFAEGEYLSEAIVDLEEAIKQREKDQRMARTYGMHFIDYFPHRELGIIYYEMGKLKSAKRELEYSLSHYPSSKARFYLDYVRKGLIEQEGEEVKSPNLTLDIEKDEFWTRKDPVVISGIAEDDNYVSAITIGHIPIFLDGSQKSISFKEVLALHQGRHMIEVTAKNLMDKVAKKQVIIHVDRVGPIVSLRELNFDSVKTGGVSIKGTIYDEAGVLDLTINGNPFPIQEGIKVFFTVQLETIEDNLELLTHDRLGNPTSAVVPLEYRSLTNAPVMLACAEQDISRYFIASLFGSKDKLPPSISLEGWTDSQTVFLEKVYIEGQVIDKNQIESLSINGNPILQEKGCYIFFSHFANLNEGENILTIKAADQAGNSAFKKITIIRKVPKALQLSERLSLSVFPFDQGGLDSNDSLIFQNNLTDALVNRNRFRVVERQKLDMILEEQKLSRTKLFDKSTALKLGRLAAAQSIITGSIIETRKGIEVVARMIDTETSDILATEDAYCPGRNLFTLKTLAEGMAIKFHRDFPLVNGLVIDRKEKNIFTDLGQDVIKLQRKLIIYREEEKHHPLTGKIIGSDNMIIGRARIVQVMPEMSKAELLEYKVKNVKCLDKVISE